MKLKNTLIWILAFIITSITILWIAYWYQNYYCVWNWVIEWAWDGPGWNWCVLWDWLDFSDKNSPIWVWIYINSPTATSTTNRNVTLYLSWYDDVWIAKMDIKESTDDTCSDIKTWATIMTDATYNNTQSYVLTEWNWQKYVCVRLSDAAWNTSDWVTHTDFFLNSKFVVNSLQPYAWSNTSDTAITMSVRWEWLSVWSFEYKMKDWDGDIIESWTTSFNRSTNALEFTQNFKTIYDDYVANNAWTTWTISLIVEIIWPDESWNPLALTRIVPTRVIVYDWTVVWSDPVNSVRVIRSIWIYQQLKNNWLITDIPYILWCNNTIVPIVVVDDDSWCFQIWSVVKIWWSLQSVVEWNCEIDATSNDDTKIVRWPLWIKNWSTDQALIRERLFNPVECSLESPESFWYDSDWLIWQ